MTDTKWRSPNGHSIASDVTDKLPPYTHPENVHTETPNYIHIGDDLLSRIDKMLSAQPDKDGCFKSLHDLGMWISRAEAALIKRALEQQPFAELLEACKYIMTLKNSTSLLDKVDIEPIRKAVFNANTPNKSLDSYNAIEILSELVSYLDMEYGEQEVDRNCPDARKVIAEQNGGE